MIGLGIKHETNKFLLIFALNSLTVNICIYPTMETNDDLMFISKEYFQEFERLFFSSPLQFKINRFLLKSQLTFTYMMIQSFYLLNSFDRLVWRAMQKKYIKKNSPDMEARLDPKWIRRTIFIPTFANWPSYVLLCMIVGKN